MEQIQKLWQYQQLDMEVDRFEREMRSSSNRQQLIKHRDFLKEQQNVVRRIEGEVTVMADRMDAIRDEITRLEESLRDLQETLEEEEPENLDIARKSLSHAQKLVNTLTRYEQELQKLRKDADVRDRQQHEVRVRAAKVKTEFDSLKQVYDVEYQEQMKQLELLKTQAQEAAKGIEPAAMDRFKAIKLHSTPPMAKLNGDRCGGCNMSLPSVVLRNIRTGKEMVECENCGRIILVEE